MNVEQSKNKELFSHLISEVVFVSENMVHL